MPHLAHGRVNVHQARPGSPGQLLKSGRPIANAARIESLGAGRNAH